MLAIAAMNRFYGIGGAWVGAIAGGNVGLCDRGDLIFLAWWVTHATWGGDRDGGDVGRGDRGDLIFLGMVGDPRYVGGGFIRWGMLGGWGCFGYVLSTALCARFNLFFHGGHLRSATVV
jgi:hypothetical protein